MSKRYDVIVIGAGHNGLVAASLLAARGRGVLMLERRGVIGGLAASDEFYPGFTSSGVLNDTSCVHPRVVEDLELERRGLKFEPRRASVLALGDDGEGLMIHGDPEEAAKEIANVSEADAESYRAYHQFLGRVGPILRAYQNEPPVNFTDVESAGVWDLIRRGMRVRRLGKSDLMEMLRTPPMCVADWLGEWFDTDTLKAALALPALSGNFTGPWSPGTNLNLLLYESTAQGRVVGGGPALIRALDRSAHSNGVEIRTTSPVGKIRFTAEGVEGVELEDGEPIDGAMVVATCDPKQVFLKLMPSGAMPYRLEHRIQSYRCRGTTAHVVLALKGFLEYRAHPGAVEYARTGGHLDAIERAFDGVKYGELPQRPVLDIYVPTISSPQLAPPEHSIVSILVHFVPQDPEPGWTPQQSQRLEASVLEVLEEQAPGVTSRVVASEVLSPQDLEARLRLSGGNILHGEQSLDQILVRPTPECVRYRTPIPGLFLGGSGSHPGGGLTGRPGYLAAQAILKG